MDEVRIRTASPADAAALAALGGVTFRDTYRGLMPDEPLEAYVADTFAVERVREELADPRNVHFLAQRAGESLGYAKLRRGTSPVPTGPSPIELERLYVRRAAAGGGIGRRLVETALAAAAGLGAETLWLGVWERNEAAIAFYARMGFEPAGAQDFELSGLRQRDLVLARPVAGTRTGGDTGR